MQELLAFLLCRALWVRNKQMFQQQERVVSYCPIVKGNSMWFFCY